MMTSQLSTYADNVALPAFARRIALLLSAGRAAIGRYRLPAPPTTANPADGLRWDRRTGGRTPYRYMDPAAHAVRAVVPIMFYPVVV